MPPAAPSYKPPFARLLLAICLASTWQGVLARDGGQPYPAAASPAVQLKADVALSPAAAPGQPLRGPTFFEADSLHGHLDRALEAEGGVVLHNRRERIEADWLRFDQTADQVEARGQVRLMQGGNRLEAQSLKLRLTERIGTLEGVRYELQRAPIAGAAALPGRGEARAAHLMGPERYRLQQASYTTCPLDDPDWVLKTDDLKLDYVTSLGTARQVRVEYLGTPILYAPWLSFSLDDTRKSGFLAPTYGVSSERGLELTLPWYWNIAPNRDATFMPRLMTQRGVQLAGEFRYLEPGYRGELALEYLPDDRLANRSRHFTTWRHQQRFDDRWRASFDVQRVSDDLYFADLSNQIALTSRAHLPRQAELHYELGWLNVRGLLQGFQTLHDPALPRTFEPYRRLPQIGVQAGRSGLGGTALSWALTGEWSEFGRRLDDGVQGRRIHLNPSLSYPLRTTYASVTPKLGWYLTRYDLDHTTLKLRDAIAAPPAGGFAGRTRSMPMFSLDGSLLLERDDVYFGKGYIQTLEPRLYYLHIPYRDQARIPVFDTGLADLSMDQLYAENQYVGFDRINDANQFTLGVTSRFLERDSGRERLAVTLGQRYYIDDQRVTLPGQVVRGGNSTDLLAAVNGQISERLRISSGLQINTDAGELSKAHFGGAWRDGPGKVINADYRYTNRRYATALNQIDLSAQWPLAPRWHGMARLNYSIEDGRLVEALAGAEYNAGCWSLRGVVQRLATTERTASDAFFLQLELRGLTQLGPNPLDILKRSIPGYVKSDEFNLP